MRSPTDAPGPDVSRGSQLIAISTPIFLFAFFVYVARIYTRIRPVFNLRGDDYVMSLAMIGAFVEWGLTFLLVSHGLGRHTYYVSPSDAVKINYIIFISEPLWLWTTTLIKVSVALALLRIKRSKSWKRWMKFIITTQVFIALSTNIIQFIQCQPIRASWDPATPGAKCWRLKDAQISLYIFSVAFIASDIGFSCIPIIFIRTLRRPLREKLVLAFLMGLGLFASAAAVSKLRYVKFYGSPGDPYWDIINLCIWGLLEQYIGIIAACIPCLKSPIERALQHCGVLSPNDFEPFIDYLQFTDESRHNLGSPATLQNLGTGS